MYSNFIEGTSDNYDSSLRKKYRSLCAVVAMLSDGEIAIPVDIAIWTDKEFAGPAAPTKTEIAKTLIQNIGQYIDIETVVCDGLYSTIVFQKWLSENKIRYEMRLHANRVDDNGIKIRNLVVLEKNTKHRTVQTAWHGLQIYVTSVKYTLKNGSKTIKYLVSNFQAAAKEHALFYSYRWNIEKFFRTAKQYLGLSDCQCIKQEKQVNHIKNIFIAYAIAIRRKQKLKLDTIEDAIRSFKNTLFKENHEIAIRSSL